MSEIRLINILVVQLQPHRHTTIYHASFMRSISFDLCCGVLNDYNRDNNNEIENCYYVDDNRLHEPDTTVTVKWFPRVAVELKSIERCYINWQLIGVNKLVQG